MSPQPLSLDEFIDENKPDRSGKIKRDSIANVPEISTLYGIDKDGNLKGAFGIEIFHNRSKPRRHRWKIELQLADDEVAIGLSRIMVPVVNITMGPYFGYDIEEDDETYGLRFGIFKF